MCLLPYPFLLNLTEPTTNMCKLFSFTYLGILKMREPRVMLRNFVQHRKWQFLCSSLSVASSVSLKARPHCAPVGMCLICGGSCQLPFLWIGMQPSKWVEDKATRKPLPDSSASLSKPIRWKLSEQHKHHVAPG